ncbi:MAG TPA: Na+/H+ antiporter subunit E [Bacilli bacterium]|nr:Na+/H+ antiporter subunit E [Bacilli bacterium]
MSFIKSHYKVFLVMMTFWLLLTLSLDLVSVLMGFVISVMVSIFSKNVLLEGGQTLFHGIKLWKLVIYIIVLFYEIFKSAISYIIIVLKHHYEPIVFELTLEEADPVKIGIIANSITLTPGTITIDSTETSITVMMLAKPGTPLQELQKPIIDKYEKYLK